MALIAGNISKIERVELHNFDHFIYVCFKNKQIPRKLLEMFTFTLFVKNLMLVPCSYILKRTNSSSNDFLNTVQDMVHSVQDPNILKI